MSDTDQIPVFATSTPAVFADPPAARALLTPVLERLAAVIDVDNGLDRPTPCGAYDVAALRAHVLGWLQFFAAALNDPSGVGQRPDPATWRPSSGQCGATIVRQAAADIGRAADAGVAGELVVMSQARMAGDAVLAMALGEYLIHGWDLAVATGAPWSPVDEAVEPARAFLAGMVQPEFRGGDDGYFGAEIEPSADATAFERLLCFAGRDPRWSPAGPVPAS